MKSCSTDCAARAIFLAALVLPGPALIAAPGVQITQEPDLLRVEVNGKLFTEYHFNAIPRPFYYPALGPDQLSMTRHWPVEDGEGEEQDHPHHRGFWYAHALVDGKDFWTDAKTNAPTSRGGCKIVHDQFLEIKSGDVGVIRSTDHWILPDGSIAMTDERTLRVFARPDTERLFDFDITLHAPADKPVVMGDDKDGTFAIRIAESMRLTHNKKGADGKNAAVPGDGHILLSTGVRDGAAWGKRADWCDYSGPVEGKTVGITIFDHPSNPQHPTWWHVRDYGLFAANPFGIHNFESKPAGTGDMTIPAGQSVTFRYRIYMHEGAPDEGKIAGLYKSYSSEP